jgi:hypothetical protein
MFRFLTALAKPSRSNRTPARRPGAAQPTVERLEDRQLLSTTSAIYEPNVEFPSHDLYAIDAQSHQVVLYQAYDFGGSREGALGGPQVTDVSASRGAGVGPEVFALATDHAVWVCTGAWHSLGGWASEISATRDGRVYVIGGNSGVYTNTDNGSPSTWQALGGRALDISAGASQLGGSDEVFAIGWDHNIWLNTTTNASVWQLVDNQRSFTRISATQNNEVYALDSNGALYRDDFWVLFYGGHKYTWWMENLVSSQRYLDIQADMADATHSEVYAIDANHTAWVWDSGTKTLQYKDSDVKEITGADDGYFFDRNGWNQPAEQAWEWRPGIGWQALGGSIL